MSAPDQDRMLADYDHDCVFLVSRRLPKPRPVSRAQYRLY